MTNTQVFILWFGFIWVLCSIIRRLWRRIQADRRRQIEAIFEDSRPEDEKTVKRGTLIKK